MFSTLQAGVLGATLALAAGSSAFAAPVSWDVANGTTGDLTFTDGRSDKGFFGNPTFDGNSFLFFPSNFEAQATNGTAATKSDKLSFTVSVQPGQEIKQINFRELGDWDILGGGSVRASGNLFVTKLNGTANGFDPVNLAVTYTDIENGTTYAPGNYPNQDGQGPWEGLVTLNLPAGITSLHIELTNKITAVAGPGGAATITKTFVGDPAGPVPQFVVGVVVPEPTTLAALGLGGLALLRRRRAELN